MALQRNVLWVDCIGAGVAGLAMLMLAGWLSRLYALPVEFVVGLGVVNLIYGAYSFSLAVRRKRPKGLIVLLVAANGCWAVFCVVAAVLVSSQASLFGIAHLVGEGSYVGWLAWMEWRLRDTLVAAG
jgi:hypothetical protein